MNLSVVIIYSIVDSIIRACSGILLVNEAILSKKKSFCYNWIILVL